MAMAERGVILDKRNHEDDMVVAFMVRDSEIVDEGPRIFCERSREVMCLILLLQVII